MKAILPKIKWLLKNVVFKNKYILTLTVFAIWILLFDSNNLIDRFEQIEKRNQLKQTKEFFLEKIQRDSIQLYELKTNNDNLEKYAREHYLMKRANEDIYVIVDEGSK